MKKVFKIFFLFFLFISSGLAIYFNYIGYFDPVKMAIEFMNNNNRDNALDIISYAQEHKIGDQQKLKKLKKEYEYKFGEKVRDFMWEGAVKGNVYNMYSGFGCLAADLMVIGDIRDLSIETYKMVSKKDADKLVAGLSLVGLGTSIFAATGVGSPVDAGVSMVKTSIKYAKNTFKAIPDSLLKLAANGKKFSSEVYRKFWILFKETKFSIPNTTTILMKIKDAKYLDSAIDLTKRLNKGVLILVKKTGSGGFVVYEKFKNLKLRSAFAAAFKRNPKGVIGFTKFTLIIHSIKFVKKHGLILSIITVLSLLPLFLASLPVIVPILIFITLCSYFLWVIFRKRRKSKQIKKANNLKSEIKNAT